MVLRVLWDRVGSIPPAVASPNDNDACCRQQCGLSSEGAKHDGDIMYRGFACQDARASREVLSQRADHELNRAGRRLSRPYAPQKP